MIILSQKQSNNINLLKGVSILLVLFIHANIKDAIPILTTNQTRHVDTSGDTNTRG